MLCNKNSIESPSAADSSLLSLFVLISFSCTFIKESSGSFKNNKQSHMFLADKMNYSHADNFRYSKQANKSFCSFFSASDHSFMCVTMRHSLHAWDLSSGWVKLKNNSHVKEIHSVGKFREVSKFLKIP